MKISLFNGTGFTLQHRDKGCCFQPALQALCGAIERGICLKAGPGVSWLYRKLDYDGQVKEERTPELFGVVKYSCFSLFLWGQVITWRFWCGGCCVFKCANKICFWTPRLSGNTAGHWKPAATPSLLESLRSPRWGHRSARWM